MIGTRWGTDPVVARGRRGTLYGLIHLLYFLWLYFGRPTIQRWACALAIAAWSPPVKMVVHARASPDVFSSISWHPSGLSSLTVNRRCRIFRIDTIEATRPCRPSGVYLNVFGGAPVSATFNSPHKPLYRPPRASDARVLILPEFHEDGTQLRQFAHAILSSCAGVTVGSRSSSISLLHPAVEGGSPSGHGEMR